MRLSLKGRARARLCVATLTAVATLGAVVPIAPGTASAAPPDGPAPAQPTAAPQPEQPVVPPAQPPAQPQPAAQPPVAPVQPVEPQPQPGQPPQDPFNQQRPGQPGQPSYSDGYAAGYGNVPAPAPVPPPSEPTAEQLRERELRKMKSRGIGLTAGGFSTFGATYLLSAIVGAVRIDTADTVGVTPSNDLVERRKQFGYRMFIPVVGPFIAIPKVSTATGGLFTGLLGVAQVAGVALGIAGLVKLGKYRRNIGITASPTPGGMQTGITLRF